MAKNPKWIPLNEQVLTAAGVPLRAIEVTREVRKLLGDSSIDSNSVSSSMYYDELFVRIAGRYGTYGLTAWYEPALLVNAFCEKCGGMPTGSVLGWQDLGFPAGDDIDYVMGVHAPAPAAVEQALVDLEAAVAANAGALSCLDDAEAQSLSELLAALSTSQAYAGTQVPGIASRIMSGAPAPPPGTTPPIAAAKQAALTDAQKAEVVAKVRELIDEAVATSLEETREQMELQKSKAIQDFQDTIRMTVSSTVQGEVRRIALEWMLLGVIAGLVVTVVSAYLGGWITTMLAIR